jgi:hypothetical protein
MSQVESEFIGNDVDESLRVREGVTSSQRDWESFRVMYRNRRKVREIRLSKSVRDITPFLRLVHPE